MILKAYKYKLKPTQTQIKQFEHILGACRFVYNLSLETKIHVWNAYQVSLSKYDLIKQLPELKSEEWIKEVPSQTLQAVVERMDRSFQRFFRGGGYPKWAKKHKYNSFMFKQGVCNTGNQIKLPKIGYIRFYKSCPIEGTIKQTVITKEYNGWYISVSCETKPKIHLISNENQVGIDVGVARFYTLSDGIYQNNPKFFYQLKKCLAHEQQILAKKQRRSNNWYKQLKVVQRIYTKITRERKDFQHQQSTRLVREYGSIVVEDLKLKNMSKSAKGTLENPGKNVKAKSGLNRSLLDAAHGQFFHMLEYKCKWYDRDFQKVDAKYTSQTCPYCEHVSKKNRKSQSEFECQVCKYTGHADHIGAVNILGRAVPIVLERGVKRCVGQESLVP